MQSGMGRAVQAVRGPLEVLRRAIYPPACMACGGLTDSEFALCGPCWREAGFLVGALVCDGCGVPLPGRDDDPAIHCDDCLSRPRA